MINPVEFDKTHANIVKAWHRS